MIRAVAACALGALAVAPVAGSFPSAAPPVAISATPTQVILAGGASTEITVLNPSKRELVVSVGRGDYSISPAGKAIVDPKLSPARSAKRWLEVSPARLRIAPGGRERVRVVAHPPKHATPGDHHALVLLTGSEPSAGQVAIRTRLGVVVLVRVTGPLVRELAITRLAVTRARASRLLKVGLANRGNVNERLLRGRVTVALRRSGRTVTTLTAPARTLLPGTAGDVAIRYRGKLRGRFSAVVRVRPATGAIAGPGAPELEPLVRAFGVRL